MPGPISVIVPAAVVDDTVRGYLLECLDRLRRNKCKLILIQNGGEPENFHVDLCWYTPKPIGFTRALNIGLRCATGRYLAQVAADVFVEDDWAEKMREDLELHGPGLACPFHYSYDGPIVKDRIWMAAWMMNREVFEKVGYHDEDWLNYRFSDQDYAIRCKMAGYNVFSTGASVVRHVEEGSTVNKLPDQLVKFEEERQIMRNRYGYEHFCDWVAAQ